MASTGIPPGFRFHPTDVELIMYYLKRKVMGKKFIVEAISEINIYNYAPWDLPDKSALKNKDRKWFFFCPTERKYNRGGRVNRSTENGYWKTTGKDRSVLYDDRVVGMVKTLVFHKGHPPRGERTDWVFHEYRLQDQQLGDAEVVQDAFVLCKLFHKNGPGPRIGAHYGAPFEEEDMGGSEVSSLGPLPEPFPSSVHPIDEDITSLAHNDILHFLSSFTGDASATVQDGISHEMLDNNNLGNNIGNVALLEMDDIFNGLRDLPNWQAIGNQASGSVAEIQPYADSFLQLGDLDTPLNPFIGNSAFCRFLSTSG
ncbi:hypothetical protein LIER_38058 [Lithospermum erythrorhizon]|uniref:NAC domain-containing protein n=1 Tax=Lithospermum erythrorhizon TaxID=34254 RepID=A0AAV3PU10_LITER